MELKLFVMRHKEGYGSTISVSKNMSDDERRILSGVLYKKYRSDGNSITELTVEGYYIYMMVYIGGVDEYNREFINVVSVIMPFQLNLAQGEELRFVMNQIKEDISNERDPLEKRYVVKFRDRSKNWKAVIGNNGSSLFMKMVFGFVFFGIFIMLSYLIIVTGFSKEYGSVTEYLNLKSTLKNRTLSDLEKYRIAMRFINKETQMARSYLEQAQKNAYESLEADYKKNPKKAKEILKRIDELMMIEDFNGIEQQLMNLKFNIISGEELDAYNYIKIGIEEYNQSINLDKLENLEKLCNDYLNSRKRKETAKVKSILRQIYTIKRGSESKIEVYALNSESFFIGKELEIDISTGSKKIKKRVFNKNKEYIGSIRSTIDMGKKIYVYVTITDASGKNSNMYPLIIPFENRSNIQTIKNQVGNRIDISLRIDDSKFKIKE